MRVWRTSRRTRIRNNGAVPEPESSTSGTAPVGFLVFDALIANTDRHHENWAVLIDRRDGTTRLAPSFDHGSPRVHCPGCRSGDDDAQPGQAVGYVPDWMLDIVRRITDADPGHRVTVALANGPETPAHLRLLCRLEARVTPASRRRTIQTSTTSRRTDQSRP